MKKLTKILLTTILSLSIFANFFMPVHAADADVDKLVAELIYYHREDSETDQLRTLDKLKAVSSRDYEQWKAINDYWTWADNEMVESIDVAPDGLPNDNTHAFVVLGYQLNDDGTMKPELVGRLTVALASANKYPNSYVVVTGGAVRNGNREADLMRDWLLANGLDDSRIIVENQSNTTVENAKFTYNILYTNYPIKTISMVTSQYHLKRGSLLYYAQSLISARALGMTPIELVGTAGWYRADLTSETPAQKASSLSQIGGVSLSGLNATNTPTSKLQTLQIDGKSSYVLGNDLEVSVHANYDVENYKRDVSNLAVITGFDANKLGTQKVVATYTEKTITKTAEFTVEVKAVAEVQKPSIAPVNAGDYYSTPTLLSLSLLSLLAISSIVYKRRKENN